MNEIHEQVRQLARLQLIMIRGEIAGSDKEIQAQVEACAEQIRAVVRAQGDAGHVALALVTAESEAGVLPRES